MKVLLVEDSRAVRAYVEGLLRSAPDIEILPAALDGETGVHLARSLGPDVILMDLELPRLDGISAIRAIMSSRPCPIVVLSGYIDALERDRTFESFQAGAVDVLGKPRGLDPETMSRFRERLLRTVRLMSQARVVRRRMPSAPSLQGRATPLPAETRPYALVVIGSSTGGPVVLYDMLSQIPAPYPLPIVIGQHIVPGFEHGLARWLSLTGHRVAVAVGGQSLKGGEVLLAPADRDLVLLREAVDVSMPTAPPTPSVNLLFRSAARAFGAEAVALLLTGMGDDGAEGLAELHRSGAMTVTQESTTCVVDGMPGAARRLNAAVHDLAPRQIAELLRLVSIACATRAS